jgi:hypothetical protein
VSCSAARGYTQAEKQTPAHLGQQEGAHRPFAETKELVDLDSLGATFHAVSVPALDLSPEQRSLANGTAARSCGWLQWRSC